MPWTRKQVKKLLSSGSPLSAKQKAKMKRELHANPEMGHKRKGADPSTFEVESHSYDWRKHQGRPRKKNA